MRQLEHLHPHFGRGGGTSPHHPLTTPRGRGLSRWTTPRSSTYPPPPPQPPVVDKLPLQAAHGNCQVQNAQDDTGTWHFRNPLHTAASGLQGRRPKEEGRVLGLITLHGLRDSTTLLSFLLGIPYPLLEHGAHLGACGHPDHHLCPRLIPPQGSPLPPPWRPPIGRARCP